MITPLRTIPNRLTLAGPFNVASLPAEAAQAGAYIIFTLTQLGHEVILDVGQSTNVKARIDNHDRKACWQKYKIAVRPNHDGLYAYIHYCRPQRERKLIKSKFKYDYRPLCATL